MSLKNGNAAENMKTRNAAAMKSSKIKTRSFLDDFDSDDAMGNCLPSTNNDAKGCTSNHGRKSDARTRRFDPSRGSQKGKRRSYLTAALKLSNPAKAGSYDDLYFTEQPYGFVSGVVTALPDNDCSKAAFT